VQDRQLYQQILRAISPWFVERVEVKLESGEVYVHLSHSPSASWQCPECGRGRPLYDRLIETMYDSRRNPENFARNQ
jgi:transposase